MSETPTADEVVSVFFEGTAAFGCCELMRKNKKGRKGKLDNAPSAAFLLALAEQREKERKRSEEEPVRVESPPQQRSKRARIPGYV